MPVVLRRKADPGREAGAQALGCGVELAMAALRRNGSSPFETIARCLELLLGSSEPGLRGLSGEFGRRSHEIEPPKNPYALPAFFGDLDLDFLSELVKGEEGGDLNYQRWADNEPNPDVAHLLRLNGKEETVHGQRVAKVISLLQ